MKNEKPIMNEKRIIRVLLAAAAVLLLCGAFCGAAAADTVSFNPGSGKYAHASELVQMLNNTASGTAELTTTAVTNDTVKLLKGVNITANHINFNNAGNIYLDLNGRVLSRDKNAATGQSVIEIYGATNLILIDSNPNEKHKFTDNSGLWILDGSGSIVVKGGVITGGTGGEGGGILIVNSQSQLTMNGGNIVGNKANSFGGGVAVYSASGLSADKNSFTMTDGTIQGNVAGNSGGGVNMEHSTDNFVMSGGLIANNTAGTNGGGVYVAGKLTLSGTAKIENNTAVGNGGGISADVNVGSGTTGYGQVIINGGSVSKNSAAGNGGGIYIAANSKFTLTDGTIGGNTAADGNTASGNGGGVYVGSSTCTFSMENSTAVIKNNSAVTGGGIMTYSSVIISGTPEISGNKATGTGDNGAGGGIYAYADDVPITINMTGGTISDNEAAGNGGGGIGIGGDYACTLSVSGGIIKSNKATSTVNGKGIGGGICIEENGIFSMTGGTIEKNTAAGNGGGISIAKKSGDTVTISGGTISENKAVTGGGIMTYRSLTLAPDTGKEIKITKNEANGNGDNGAGGGIYCWNATVTISDGVEISENKAVGNGGGGVCIENNNATLTMTGGLIKKNITQPLDSRMVNYVGMGGGVRIASGASFEFSGGTITENETIGSSDTAVLSSGGGVAILNDAKIVISGDAEISYNKSTSNGGGGLWIGDGANADCSMSGGEIAYNTTSGNGGGVDINGSAEYFEITGGKIHNNTAEHSGGGIAVLNGGTLEVKGTAEITGNTAANVGGGTGLGGGIFAWKSSKVSISENVRITGNTANGVGGGGICIEGSTLNLTGGRISGNHTSDGSGAGIYIIDDAAENAFGVLKVSGNPVVTENRNLWDAALSNIRLPASGKIILTDKLASGAVLFVNNENRESGFVFAEFSDDYSGIDADKNADAAKFRFDGDHSPGCFVLSDGTLKWGVPYTVSFETFGYGTPAPADQEIHQGGYAIEPTPVISEPGFIFNGWYADDQCTTKWDFEADSVNTDTTLYAKWELEPPVLTFDDDEVEAISRSYDGMVHELKAEHVRDDVKYHWLKHDEELNNSSSSCNLRDVSDSGSYAVFVSINKGGVRYSSSPVRMDITIVPLQVTITAKDQTIIRGNDIKHGVEWVETTELGAGDELAGITLKKDESKQEITPSDAKVVRETEDVNENYTFTYYPGVLTLTKRTETSKGTSIWLKDTAAPTATPTPVPTPAAQETPTAVETPVPTKTTTTPFPIAAALAGLGAVAVLLLRRQ